MENLIYWNGKPVGREAGARILFFPSAPREAVVALTHRQAPAPAAQDAVPAMADIVAALQATIDTIPVLASQVGALIEERTAVPEKQAGAQVRRLD